MRAVPEVGLAATQIESYVLLRVLSIFNTSNWRCIHNSVTRGKTTLGPRAVAAKFIILIGWVSGLLLWFVAREETVITSQLERINTSNHHILERH